jgi:hypothetical protein
MERLIIPPAPLKKGGNYKEKLIKSPFDQGGLGEFKNLQAEGIYGKCYKPDKIPSPRRGERVRVSWLTPPLNPALPPKTGGRGSKIKTQYKNILVGKD